MRSDNLISELNSVKASGSRPGLLLHTCCAPCSTYVLELLREVFDLTLYFYDPNIHPREEYEARRDEMRRYAERLLIPFTEGPYDVDRWFEVTKGHESGSEGSERCFICYEMRLSKAARFARDNGFEYFGTVLSISPHKKAEKINEIGLQLAGEYGIKYLKADFKKRDGFKRSIALSKEHGLYRQDYCGCVYSKKSRVTSSESGVKDNNSYNYRLPTPNYF
ncbi:MAG TPA: epoxyqueuosine reductase QueH [Thermodesulfobacteriota bacterium]|nr:epoxyqueuosine reductase QueH [Thermodesulfobacteriota bacterium]